MANDHLDLRKVVGEGRAASWQVVALDGALGKAGHADLAGRATFVELTHCHRFVAACTTHSLGII